MGGESKNVFLNSLQRECSSTCEQATCEEQIKTNKRRIYLCEPVARDVRKKRGSDEARDGRRQCSGDDGETEHTTVECDKPRHAAVLNARLRHLQSAPRTCSEKSSRPQGSSLREANKFVEKWRFFIRTSDNGRRPYTLLLCFLLFFLIVPVSSNTADRTPKY